VEQIEINGEIFLVQETLTDNKNATARLRGNAILIGIPSRWPSSERERAKTNLKKRAIKSIEKGKWKKNTGKRLEFTDGQNLVVLGDEFQIHMAESERLRVSIIGRKVNVLLNKIAHDKSTVARRVTKEIAKVVMPKLKERIERINNTHFNSEIRAVRIKDIISRWGSCSTKGVITLNFRLLMMPEEILDYVIVHELAHTKYLSHGQRFWGLVERIMPDHMEKRKWLKDNGWTVNSAKVEQLEEPY
jgi:predicted metal-dependent hydrolase